MKQTLFLIAILLFTISTLQAQNSYFLPDKGKVKTFDVQTAKGKVVSYTRERLKTPQVGNVYTLTKETVKPDGKVTDSYEYSFRSDSGYFYSDIRTLIGEMEKEGMTVTNKVELIDQLRYPAEMTVGDKLPDFTLKVAMEDAEEPLRMDIFLSNHSVAARESITTPAGAFDCLRIDYDQTMNMSGMKIKSSTRTWYAKGIGMVKLEMSMDKRGIQSIVLLSKVETNK